MTRNLTMTALTLAAALPTAALAQATGSAQLAAQIGVNAERFSATELVQLRSELQDGNRQGVNLILGEAGSDLTYDQLSAGIRDRGVDLDVTPDTVTGAIPDTSAKEQLAAPLGVDAADFTVNELVDLQAAVDAGDENDVRAILSEAGVDPSSVTVN